MKDHDGYRPRRSLKLWMWPRWLSGAALVMSGVLIGFALAPWALQPRVQVVHEVEYRDWKVTVPTTPNQCYKMLKAANDLRNAVATALAASKRVDQQILKAIPNPNPEKMLAAGRAVDGLAKNRKQINDADDKFQDQYKECADA